MTIERVLFSVGAASAFVAVGAGAFGAHALKARLEPQMLAVFEIAARYQMYHALALLACAWAAAKWPGLLVITAAWLFIGGSLAFSGSLYALSLTGIRAFGAIAPIGGLALLGGWACLAVAALKS